MNLSTTLVHQRPTRPHETPETRSRQSDTAWLRQVLSELGDLSSINPAYLARYLLVLLPQLSDYEKGLLFAAVVPQLETGDHIKVLVAVCSEDASGHDLNLLMPHMASAQEDAFAEFVVILNVTAQMDIPGLREDSLWAQAILDRLPEDCQLASSFSGLSNVELLRLSSHLQMSFDLARAQAGGYADELPISADKITNDATRAIDACANPALLRGFLAASAAPQAS